MKKFLEESGRPQLHGDRALRSGSKEYKSFVAEGCSRGIVRLGLRQRERVKLFFVG